MRTFATDFQTKLDATTFNPVVFVEYELKEYISGSEPDSGSLVSTTYRWAEREIIYDSNTYEQRIVAVSPLTETLDGSNQVFGEMAFEIANHPTNLMTIIQAGMKVTVYLGFEDSIGSGTVTEAEILFIGTVEGDIEITEDALSFNVQDIAFSYDSEIPQKIRTREFPNADRHDIGNPMPLVFGRVKDHVCMSVEGDFSSFLAEDATASTELGSEFVPTGASDFQQTESSLDNSTTGGYWYAQDKLGYTVDGLSTSESGNGVIITPNTHLDRSRFIYSNSNVWALPWGSTYIDTKWCSTWLISFTISSWKRGWIRVGSEAWKERDDAKTDVANTGDKRWSRKFSPYANDVRNGEANYGSDITYKVVREIDSDNASDTDPLIIEVSPDFIGVLKNVSIKPIDVSSSQDYIYVSDDVTHWFRGNVSTVGGSNATYWSGSVTIESRVPELGFGEVPNIPSGESDDDSPQDPPAGSLQYESFGVDSIELDTSGYSYLTVADENVTVEFDADNKTITRSSGSFITDGYTTDDNHFLSSTSSLNSGSRHLTIASVTATVITVNESIVDEGQDSSEIAEHNDGNSSTDISFLGNEITDAGYGIPFEYEDFQAGQTLTIVGSSNNDGDYTITDVDDRVITVSSSLITESAGSAVYLIVTGTGVATELSFEKRLLAPKNLWKLTLDRPIALDHFVNDVVSLSHNNDERFLVADHPVDSITNVRVNNIPVAFTAYPSDSYNCYSDYKRRAYIEIDSDEIRNKIGLSLVDDSFLENYQDVNDDITLEDDGHSHTSGGSATFSHQLDVYYHTTYHGSNVFEVRVFSGSFNQVIATSNGSTRIDNPISFTSSSPNVRVIFNMIGKEWFVWHYATCSFMRTDNATGDLVYDYRSRGLSNNNFILDSAYPVPTDGSVVGTSPAEVIKIGNADSRGDNADTGSLYFSSPISIAQARSNLRITCDVIGQVDGSTGYKMPHQQIKALINKYATNPINGTEGSADIVEFVNESEMDTAFSKVYNTLDNTETASDVYPKMRELITNTGAYNPSPNADLGNSTLSSSTETVNGVEPILYNEKSIHSLDFSLNNSNQLREVVGEMLLQSNMILNWRNGIAYIKYLGDSPSADATYTNADIMIKSMSLSRTPISELATDITINFDTGNSGYSRNYHYVKQSWNNGVLSETQLDATRKYGSYTRDRYFELPMIREHAGAEIMAKRFYDEHSDVKFHAGFSTTLNNLASEVGDNITVPIPIHRDSMMDKGLVTKKIIQFGSATTKQADLINLEIRENHTTSGYYLSLIL